MSARECASYGLPDEQIRLTRADLDRDGTIANTQPRTDERMEISGIVILSVSQNGIDVSIMHHSSLPSIDIIEPHPKPCKSEYEID